MTLITTAIVTKATDSGEYDKRVKLLTADSGMLFATLRGVRKSSAKLKFAAQAFAFCEFTLTKKGSYYIVTGAREIESLFDLAQDSDVFLFSSIILEASDITATQNPDAVILPLLLKAFKKILFDNVSPESICADYLEAMLSLSGFAQSVAAYNNKIRLAKLINSFEQHLGVELKSSSVYSF